MFPEKTELKAFRKVFDRVVKAGIINLMPIVGLFIDTAKDEKPYFVIGIYKEPDDELKTQLEKALYKKFFDQTVFKFVNLGLDFDNKDLFLKQAFDFQ